MYVHYPSLIFLVVSHLLALAALPYIYFYGITGWELGFNLGAWLLGGLGITALYHRAWTHNAAQFSRPVEYLLAIFSIFMVQMPARQWISSHIKHHQFTDSPDDPYNIQRGFWWAHVMWIIFAPVPPVSIPERLEKNPVVHWQERYYWPLSALLNVGVPILISLAAGAPWWGGVLLSFLRMMTTIHQVFAVNSVCHLWGTQPFTKEVSARDVWWFPFALGEQYHNYHHIFPRDYRHGIRKLDFDPTKWLIFLLSKAGLAKNLVSMPASRVEAARRKALAEPS